MPMRLQPPQQLEAAHVRHAHVGDDAARARPSAAASRKAAARLVGAHRAVRRVSSRKASESRTASSSSMTWTIGVSRHRSSSSVCDAPQGEAEDRAAARDWLRPRSGRHALRRSCARSTGPTPMPCRLVVTKGWNSCSATSGAMPGPVSATLTCDHAVRRRRGRDRRVRARGAVLPWPRWRCGSG